MTRPEEHVVHPGTTVPPVEPNAELARTNLMWGFALFAIALLIAGGTIVVALIWNGVADY